MNISTIIVCSALSLLGTAAFAGPTGTLSGQVRDSHGKPIVGAQIKIVETAEVTGTDSHGNYTFLDEDPGTHLISANADKYKVNTLKATISAGSTEKLDFVLQPDSHHRFNTIKIAKPGTSVIVEFYSGPSRRKAASPDPQETFPGDVGLHTSVHSR